MEIDNKVFCALPFTYLYVDSINEYKVCSDARLSSHISTNEMSILDYYNSDYLNEIRFDMLRGELSDDIKGTCVRCIEREELGSWSRRIKSIDPKIIKDFKKGIDLIPRSNVIKFKFGNLCNLKCLMCGPYSSSRWAKERDSLQEMEIHKELLDQISAAELSRYGDLYQKTFNHEFFYDMERLTYNFDEKFYKEFKIILKYVNTIVVSGGEPFLNDEVYEFIRWLIENKFSSKVHLIILSNMTKVPKNFKSYFNKFNKFSIHVSIDGVGKKDEYIRRGTIFEEKDKNIKQIIDYFNIDFFPTLSILNVGYQDDLISYCKQFNKTPIFHNVLVEPFFFQITDLPNHIIDIYRKRGQEHKLFESKLKNTYHFSLGIQWLKRYDNIHKTNLLDEYPEFEAYYK